MDKETRDFLIKKAQELKEEAKRYFLKKVAATKIVEQYLILKELEKNEKDF